MLSTLKNTFGMTTIISLIALTVLWYLLNNQDTTQNFKSLLIENATEQHQYNNVKAGFSDNLARFMVYQNDVVIADFPVRDFKITGQVIVDEQLRKVTYFPELRKSSAEHSSM